MDLGAIRSWCAPSRAQLLTGKLPHGILGLDCAAVNRQSYDPARFRFWPAALRRAGYETALVGKWHLGPDSGHGRDWDHSVVWPAWGLRGDWYNDQLMAIDGAPPATMPGYVTDLFTERTVAFVEGKREKPWLLWLCYTAPHIPNTVHPRHQERYGDVAIPIPPDIYGPRAGKPEWMQRFTMWTPGTGANEGLPLYTNQPLPALVRGYNRLVCAVDEGVGRIYAALEKTGQLDNTLIVFTSDQGFTWGDKGFAWKVGPYEACMRMPMIVRLPGVAARGAVCRRPVRLIDLPPTIFALAKTPLPWEMHGHDLRPLLKNPRARWEHPVLLENFNLTFGAQTDAGTSDERLGNVPWWLSLRDDRYKYIRTLLPGELDELYDLQEDPHEMRNLALEPAHRQRLATYRSRLTAELRRTGAAFADRLPPPMSERVAGR